MKTTRYEDVQKRTKRVVVIHNVPVQSVIDGVEMISTDVGFRLEKLLSDALTLGLERVELWFSLKEVKSKKAA